MCLEEPQEQQPLVFSSLERQRGQSVSPRKPRASQGVAQLSHLWNFRQILAS